MSGNAARFNALIRGKVVPSRWFSSRKGARVRLIVFHTTQGARTNKALGSWFNHPKAKVSSHVGIDDKGVVRFVPESYSAWTAGNANPVSTQAELCAFAEWSVAEWGRHPEMLELAAQWAAAASEYHGIPLRRVRGKSTRTGFGVTMHVDCTHGFGGTHTDCGPAMSAVVLDKIINRAQAILAGANTQEEDPMALDSKIRDANPYRDPKSPEVTTLDLVLQDIQANSGYSGRQSAQVLAAVTQIAEQQKRTDALIGQILLALDAKTPGSPE